jgi:hypothetical protein
MSLALGCVQKTIWRRGARWNERQEAHRGRPRPSSEAILPDPIVRESMMSA